METRPIRFHHGGGVVAVHGVATTRSVLDWLREDARCTGTKEGCAEGDCGACTVVIGELRNDGLEFKAVNSCTAFVGTLDGKALLTVEDVGSPSGLHPVQQAMVQCHGSQCGFCTPGFVMSLFACYEKHRHAGTVPTRQQIADDLSGNLCRCTGYRPILDAGQRMFELPPKPLDRAAIVRQLKALQGDVPLAYEHDGRRFWSPRTVDELARLGSEHPHARLLAGSTDIGLWVTKQFRELGDVIHLSDVDALKAIEERDGSLHIGAGATLEAAWSALVARWPQLQDLWLRFGSLPVRNAGTMGGSVANGSPIGDSAPVLMALGASLELRSGSRPRTIALDDFYVDYMKNRLEAGEFVQAIVVPLNRRGTVRAYKVSKRFDCDISAVCAGLAVERDGDGIVTEARFAYGGMAAIVKRAANAEGAVLGRKWDEAAAQAAMDALEGDFTPMTDMRAGAGYRMAIARRLLKRFWLETRAEAPLAADQLNVWARPASPAFASLAGAAGAVRSPSAPPGGR
jgi:xanthine dehydrogenase small subunit